MTRYVKLGLDGLRGAMAVLGVMGCAAGPSPHSSQGNPPLPAPPSSEPEVAPAPTASATAASSLASPAPPTPIPEVELLTWSQSLEKPAAGLAIGKRRVAVLERAERPGRYPAVWMKELEGGDWRRLALPDSLQPQNTAQDALQVFFGRDDRPRLMGTRRENGRVLPLYYRFKGTFFARTGEIARLEGGEGALFGWLGHDDPEVVCKLGELCIIKRLTGWKMVDVPPVEHLVRIAGGSAFAVGVGSALRIDPGDAAWRKVSSEVPWEEPLALAPLPDGALWVADAEHLHYFDGTTWSTSPSPIAQPRDLWGRAPNDVWLAAREGVAHYDGAEWRRLRSPTGEFSHVMANSTDVWLGGATGVWVGK